MNVRRSGFTLIELLVVISIISLLSSIVLASLNTARGKGSLAAAKTFAQSLDNAISNQAVGWWDFDECSGSVVGDKSGYNNTGTIYNSGGFSSNTPTGVGCSLSFNGSTSYIDIAGSNSSTAALNITGSSITMASWVLISGSGSRQILEKANSTLGTGRQYGMYITGSNNSLGCNIVTSSTPYDAAGGSISAGLWHHVACVYDGSKVSYYVDGQLIASNALTGTIVAQPADVTIGAFTTGPQSFFSGNLESVRIIPSALVASDIQRLYASEAPRFGIALK